MLLTRSRIKKAGYVPILVVGMGLMFARLLLMAKLLPLAEFADLSAALVVAGIFTMLSCLGVFADLQRRLPALLVRNQGRLAAVHVARTAVLAVAIAGFLLILSLIVPSFRFIFVLGVVHGLSQQLFLTATTFSRSNNDALTYSFEQLARAVLTIVADVGVVMLVSSASIVLIAEASCSYLISALIFVQISRRTKTSIPVACTLAVRSLRRVEWPAMLVLLAYSTLSTTSAQTDRWISTVTLSRADFAIYSFAWIVMLVAFSVQAVVNASAYPMIARRMALYGRSNAFRITAMLSIGFIGVSALLFLPGVLLVNLAVDRFYPHYVAAKPLIWVLAAAAVFSVSNFWSSFLLIAGHERSLLGTYSVALAIAGAVWFYLFSGHIGLDNLAYLALGLSMTTHIMTAGRAYFVRQ